MDWGLVGSIAIGLAVAWAALVALLWILRPRDARLGELLRVVPDIVRLLRALLGDPATPLGARVAVIGLTAWLVSPIDLIPEFIPVLGPLDDVIVAILVLRYVRRRLGAERLRERWPGSPEGYALLARLIG